MNIQFMYSDLDLDANDMETEFQAAFEDILWFVNAHLAKRNHYRAAFMGGRPAAGDGASGETGAAITIPPTRSRTAFA